MAEGTEERFRPSLAGTNCTERSIAIALLFTVWFAFSFPALAGKVRFPVYFSASPAPAVNASMFDPNPELGDAFFTQYPWYSHLGRSLRAGRIPLWDPHRFTGMPFAANSQIGVFYPANWLYASGHILAVFTFVAIASILAALFLSYWFFRLVDLRPYAAVAGAIGFVCSAFMIKWSGHAAVFASAMWLPLALGGIELIRQGRFRRGIFFAATGMALSALGGHIQVTLYMWLAVFIWASFSLGETIFGIHRGEQVWPVFLGRIGAVAASFTLAAGLAAVQLIPTGELVGHVTRGVDSYAEVISTALPLEHLPTLLLPDYLGNPIDDNYVGPGVNYTETAFYPGIVLLPLAVAGLFCRARRLSGFFALIAVIGFLSVFGTPFFRLIFALPGFSRPLFVTRFILFINFGLAGLAGLGVQAIAGRSRPALISAALTAVVSVFAVVLLTVRGHSGVAQAYADSRAIRALVLLVLAMGAIWIFWRISQHRLAGIALVAVLAADLWLFGFRYHPFEDPRPILPRHPEIEQLSSVQGKRARYTNAGKWLIPPNSPLRHGLYELGGYDAFILKRPVELISIAEDKRAEARRNWLGPFSPEAFRSPIMDLLGVRTVAGMAGESVGAGASYTGQFSLYDRPSALPAAFVAGCTEIIAPHKVIGRLSAMTRYELLNIAVVEGRNGETTSRECSPGGEAHVRIYEPERVVLSARSAKGGLLVLTDAWYPGWKAKVDGREAEVVRTDYALRGIRVPAGSHRVELLFSPDSFKTGVAVTAMSALLLGIMLFYPRGASQPSGTAKSNTPAIPSDDNG